MRGGLGEARRVSPIEANSRNRAGACEALPDRRDPMMRIVWGRICSRWLAGASLALCMSACSRPLGLNEDTDQHTESGATGTRAKGEEGSLGNAAPNSKRYAIQGPRDSKA